MLTLYVISNETGRCVAQITGETNAACEAKADAEYGSNDYAWTYTPAFGFVGGAKPGRKVRKLSACDDAARLRSLIEQGGLTQRGAARELEISERMMRYYCSGAQPVPKVVMLALEHLVTCSTR